VLGLSDIDPQAAPDNLLTTTLAPGIRRLPTPTALPGETAAAATPLVLFAGVKGDSGANAGEDALTATPSSDLQTTVEPPALTPAAAVEASAEPPVLTVSEAPPAVATAEAALPPIALPASAAPLEVSSAGPANPLSITVTVPAVASAEPVVEVSAAPSPVEAQDTEGAVLADLAQPLVAVAPVTPLSDSRSTAESLPWTSLATPLESDSQGFGRVAALRPGGDQPQDGRDTVFAQLADPEGALDLLAGDAGWTGGEFAG
jgi:hypothetical protein